MKEKKGSFSGSIGFVLAAAGSAVGVGNIWRFPYLCAKDGGGLFLIIYLVLVLLFEALRPGRNAKMRLGLLIMAVCHILWRRNLCGV